MNSTSENMLVISPIGEFEDELVDHVRSEIHRVFGYSTEILSLLDDVNFAFDPRRDQHHSTPILEKLAGLMPARGVKVLAITTVDLFIPILTHVYGEAQLGGKACIISTCRLDEGISKVLKKEVYLFRVAKEAIHELGHTFKLLHCKDRTCIMHYCREIQDVDRKSDQLCRYCRILLNDERNRLD